jgi:hypothetical protein
MAGAQHAFSSPMVATSRAVLWRLSACRLQKASAKFRHGEELRDPPGAMVTVIVD